LACSDNCIVTFSLALSFLDTDRNNNASVNLRPNFSKADWPALCEYLVSFNWIELGSYISACAMWDRFINIVTFCVAIHVPCYSTEGSVRGHTYYLLHVKNLIRKKTGCWRLYRRCHTDVLYAKYKRLAKECSCAVKQYQTSIEAKLIENGNLGAFYKFVNKKLNGSNGIAPLRDENGILHLDNADKAALLNQYFSSVFTNDNGIIDSSRLPKQVQHKMQPFCFTPPMVLKYIHKLKASSGAGPDGLPPSFLGLRHAPLLRLSLLFLTCHYKLDLFLRFWKHASIASVFKKGSPSNPCNYRPISITCIACKLLECGVKDGILDFLKQHKIIDASHHGFMTNKSTTSHLLECPY
jgi:hypothetical protein